MRTIYHGLRRLPRWSWPHARIACERCGIDARVSTRMRVRRVAIVERRACVGPAARLRSRDRRDRDRPGDILTDFTSLASAHGVRGGRRRSCPRPTTCWGTFVLYHRTATVPTTRDQEIVEHLGRTSTRSTIAIAAPIDAVPVAGAAQVEQTHPWARATLPYQRVQSVAVDRSSATPLY